MNEPYSDAYMRYDELKHRYILTPKCVLDELGIDMEARLSAKGSAIKANQDILQTVFNNSSIASSWAAQTVSFQAALSFVK